MEENFICILCKPDRMEKCISFQQLKSCFEVSVIKIINFEGC